MLIFYCIVTAKFHFNTIWTIIYIKITKYYYLGNSLAKQVKVKAHFEWQEKERDHIKKYQNLKIIYFFNKKNKSKNYSLIQLNK